MTTFFLLLGAIATSGTGKAASADVVESVFRRQAELAAERMDASYIGEYLYQEYDGKGELKREETCRRRVFRKGYDRQHIEFLNVAVNGKELEGRRRERQIWMLRRKGLVQDEARMPFRLETRDAYDYELEAADTCCGRSAWVLEFEPKRRSMQTVVGKAWVSQASGDVLRLEFRPAWLPWVCVGTRMVLHFGEQQGPVLPTFFEMDMGIRVKVFVTLAERRIRVEDRFSDYRFNQGLPDSMFD
jgi:hypothetical protein